ncbi:MAG: hypothetical protein ACTSYI_00375 [Promethearchaeota archaeon]
MAELEIDCQNNLGKIILPCARCLHAISIQETKHTFRISCDFKQLSGNLSEILRISRTCPHYSQNLNCLSKFLIPNCRQYIIQKRPKNPPKSSFILL